MTNSIPIFNTTASMFIATWKCQFNQNKAYGNGYNSLIDVQLNFPQADNYLEIAQTDSGWSIVEHPNNTSN
jgi:hypothetical protein